MKGGRQMKKGKLLKQWMRKLIKSTAIMEANSACAFMNFQPKETKEIKELRRF